MTGRIGHPSQLRRDHAYTTVQGRIDRPRSEVLIKSQAIFSSLQPLLPHLSERLIAQFHPYGQCWHVNHMCFWNPKSGWASGESWFTEIFDDGPLTAEQQRWYDEMNRQDSTAYRLDLAGRLAEFFLSHHAVRRVGLFGSVARGEPISHDIDLVLFVDADGLLMDYLSELEVPRSVRPYALSLETMLQMLGYDSRAIDLLFYGQPWYSYANSTSHFEVVYQRCNMIMLPISPNNYSDWLERFQEAQWDPQFVANLTTDCRLFEPHTGSFGTPGVLKKMFAFAAMPQESVPA